MFGSGQARLMLAIVSLSGARLVAQRIDPLSEFSEFVRSPALSPDGKILAFESEDGGISWSQFADTARGVIFVSPDDRGGLPTNPKWSPTGKQIAFLRFYCMNCNHQLFVKGYPQGDEHALGEVCGGPPSWTPDGRFLVAAEPVGDNENCRIALIPVNGGRRSVIVEGRSDFAAVSPDGKQIASAAGNRLNIARLTTDYHLAGAPVTIAEEPHAITSINWLPNGEGLVYQVRTDGNYYSRLISIARDGRSQLLNPGANVEISQILTDGTALGAERGGDSTLWRVDLNAPIQEPVKVRSAPWTDRLLAVSPDAQLLAFATNRSGPTEIWISRLDGSNPRVLVSKIPPFGEYGDNTVVDGISWSPDGRWIAMLTEPGVGHGVEDARLFLVPATGGGLRKLADCSQDVNPPPWSDDSQSVFIEKDDENYRSAYFRVEISTGKQTEVPESKLPVSPRSVWPSLRALGSRT